MSTTVRSKSSWLTLQDYVVLSRPEHWMKHIFIFPGAFLAWLLAGPSTHRNVFAGIVFGLASACLLASANYVINGLLDREHDGFHPDKKSRPAVAGRINKNAALTLYAVLLVCGLYLASFISTLFLGTALVFVFMGVLYNVPPLRLKDLAFLDVMTESVNNPLRLVMGWAMVTDGTIPPLSLTLSYWFGGAFLMAAKRLAEYRYMTARGSLDSLQQYRASFRSYSESSLTLFCFLNGLLSSFFVGGFLIKYRNEYLFLFPFLAFLFAYYLKMSLDIKSVVQRPEKLYQDKGLVALVVVITVLFVVLSSVHIPLAEKIVGFDKGLNYIPW